MTKGKSLPTVTFAKPIERGEQKIESIQLREFSTGEIRGLNMVDLVQLQTDALITLVPRISLPPLTKNEVEALPPSEMFKIATEIANFLVPGTPGESNSGSPPA